MRRNYNLCETKMHIVMIVIKANMILKIYMRVEFADILQTNATHPI